MTEDIAVWGQKDPDDADTFAVDFEKACARIWLPNTDFAASTRIRVYSPASGAGYDHEWSGGRTGARVPKFGASVNQTAVDGSGVWTCRTLSSASLYRTISGTPTWTADSGITVANEAIADTVATATLSGGTDGNDYTVLVKATFSDSTSRTQVCILPVKRPVNST